LSYILNFFHGGNNSQTLISFLHHPQCNVPIEKNDGCNHMTCSNPSCRHEFWYVSFVSCVFIHTIAIILILFFAGNSWICRKDWKLHGTATGGFFRCNIWQEEGAEFSEGAGARRLPSPPGAHEAPTEVVTDVANDQGYGTSIHAAREQWKERQEMARFLHHYTRWEAHGESATLERKMGDAVCTRLAPVVDAAIDFDGSPTFNFGGKGES
jgi:ankyrin repeat/IBR domain-containing protein 1